MNLKGYLLSCLAEECGETIKDVMNFTSLLMADIPTSEDMKKLPLQSQTSKHKPKSS